MSSPGPTNGQGRIVLQAMCNFILPFVQTTSGQSTVDADDILSGVEADKFVNALEIFISGVISHFQQGRMGIDIEVGLKNYKAQYNVLGAPIQEGEGSHSNEDQDHIPSFENVFKEFPEPPLIRRNSYDEDDPLLKTELDNLQKHITQKMPIRLLRFEPHGSKLNISLVDRADVFNYLAPKIRADFPKRRSSWYHRPATEYARYAILSHTWSQTPGELTYGDWCKGSLNAEHPKCQKLVNFCKAAWEDYQLTLGWLDTVCINKESSAELDESIRSMYSWYSNATVCITYLGGTYGYSDMHNDPWFSRGWTLQELVAPNCIKFYSMHWKQFNIGKSSNDNDKHHPSILKCIQLATTITPSELHNIRGTSISRRMQLAAKRKVTREEDIAYSLMGIFNVSISTAYGEGHEQAFFRLVKEIFDSTKDVSDIFNWGGDCPDFGSSGWTPITSLFPSAPSDFESRSSKMRHWHPIEPLTLTHMGLRTPVLLMPVLVSLRSAKSMGLSLDPIGDYSGTVTHQTISPSRNQQFGIERGTITKILDIHTCYVLAKRTFEAGFSELTFGTLNVEPHGTGSIRIPKTCLALLLNQDQDRVETYTKIYTQQPIVFDLVKSGSTHVHKNYYEIERDQLESHGMTLVTLYL